MRITSLLLLFVLATAAHAMQTGYSAQELYERYRGSILQVQITNKLSKERSSLGTGFYISDDGLILTNYHVISSAVQKPESYRVEIIQPDGTKQSPDLVDFDLINDLALLRVKSKPSTYFKLTSEPLHKGARILSLGNPNDLGMTVVNGSYSGNMENSLYERIHFSGAINPGMSGGPAIDEYGNVIGINVATSGNGVGFLVPAKFALQLVEKGERSSAPLNTSENIQHQLQINQQHFMKKLLAEKLPVSSLGEYQLPDKIAAFMNCWGDSNKDKKDRYEIVTRVCTSRQDIFIDEDYSTGLVFYKQKYIHATGLNALRFSSLYADKYRDYLPIGGGEDYHSNFQCNNDFVNNGSVNMKVSLCLRGYKKVAGLFDMVLVAASLQDNYSGMQTTVLLTGVSYDNAQQFADSYLKAISWKE